MGHTLDACKLPARLDVLLTLPVLEALGLSVMLAVEPLPCRGLVVALLWADDVDVSTCMCKQCIVCWTSCHMPCDMVQ